MTHRMPAVLALCLACRLAAGADRFPAKGGDIEITPLLHASVQVEHAGKVILVDPWSFGGLSLAKPADLILISDDVGHHLDAKAVAKFRKPGAPVIMPASGKPLVPDGIVLGNGESTTAASIRVESIAAYDVKPGAPEHPKGGPLQPRCLPGGLTVAQSLAAFKDAMKGAATEVRLGRWYP